VEKKKKKKKKSTTIRGLGEADLNRDVTSHAQSDQLRIWPEDAIKAPRRILSPETAPGKTTKP